MFEVIAFDADDTLWHNEPLFTHTQDRLRALLARYNCLPTDDDLYATEKRNLEYFGYGAKSFALSMIETAIELTQGEIQGRDIQTIIDMVKDMLRTPAHLLEHVETIIPTLAASYRLMLITKGDLFEQETKIVRSGLESYFTYIEIITEKSEATYQKLFARHGLDIRRVLMVGNSLRSDVLPVLALGGNATYIPYATTWIHERVSDDDLAGRAYFELAHIGLLPRLIEDLSTGTASTERQRLDD